MALFDNDAAGLPAPGPSGHELLVPQDADRRLARVLAFCGLELSDVLGCPVARRTVQFYLAVDAEVERRAGVIELERQWNPTGTLR